MTVPVDVSDDGLVHRMIAQWMSDRRPAKGEFDEDMEASSLELMLDMAGYEIVRKKAESQ